LSISNLIDNGYQPSILKRQNKGENKKMSPIELKKTLSQNMKKIRKQQGLSQFALAEKSSVSEATVKSIELTRLWPSEKTLAQIAEALGVEVFSLFLPNSTQLSFDTKKSREIKKLIAKNIHDYVDEIFSEL